MADGYALVLTGEVLPGFAPELVWPKLAAYLSMEPAQLMQLAARAPLIIKEDGDLGKLNAWQAGIAQAGAQSEICPPDERPALFVLLDGTPHGPVPHVMVEHRVRQGLWADSLNVAEGGSAQWKPYSELDAAAAAPPIQIPPAPPPLARPASSEAPRSVWAAPKSMQGLTSTPEPGLGPLSELPPGNAIHAGFWRRVAASVLDFLIIFIPLIICNIIPIIGTLIGIAGQWLYFALQDSSPRQATLGKRALGIKVVDKCGRQLGFGRATWRFFSEVAPLFVIVLIAISVMVMAGFGRSDAAAVAFGFISLIFGVLYIVWFIGFLMAAWTRRKQSLFDMMAGTLIVFKQVQPGQPLPTERPPMPWYGWALIFVPPVFGAMLGIIAAIALPAYQDYTVRAKVSEAITATAPVKAEIASNGCTPQSRPSDNNLIEELQIQKNESGQCRLTITFDQSSNVPKALRGGQIVQTAGEDQHWDCAVSDKRLFKYVPSNCRNLADDDGAK